MDTQYRLAKHRGRYVVQWYEAVTDGDTFEWKRRRVNLKLAYKPENRSEAEKLLADFKSQQMNALDASVKEVWRSYKMANPGGQFYAENHIMPFFGDLDTNKISVPMCQAYIEKRRKEGAKDSTIRRELASLKAAVRKFALEGHRGFAFELPSPPPPKDRWLTRDEFRDLRQAFESMPHLALFIEIAIATAARKSAICQMRWDQVDFERKQIDLRGDGDATNKRRAIVPMTDTLCEKLAEAKSIAMTDYVIEYGGHGVERIDKSFRSRVEKIKHLSDVTPHVLRHTAAVWMAECRIPMSEISQYLGHTNTKVTESVYARYSPDFLRHAAAALNV